MSTITGLHHVTCISGDAQENIDFYVGLLGMRLVKRSVNQDDPGTYHLFYADGEGHPGSDLTFFPWKNMPRGRRGAGLTNEVSLAVPAGSLGFWAERLRAHGVSAAESVRFGEATLTFEDPHGLVVSLVETADPREFTPWADSPVAEEHQVRGLHSVRIVERELAPTTQFLTEGMGLSKIAEEDGWQRWAVAGGGGSGRVIDLQEQPTERRGTWGVGSVHHVAWRVPDDAAEREAQSQVLSAGARPTEVIDRFWFKSVYFKEPGGALFEIATDGPGFGIDENAATLGEHLVLPPFLEAHRAEIERRLPPITLPHLRPASTSGD
jgi:glyoxalase family protein